ncbi:hypothetical protein SO802_035390 [Lithocarpus litseifolius]|uniref:Uncharacterized protein n=1 Tax=Lithocarpus litseifolius TaxID=425828 RepID=A0AAW2BA79_9ROSI
MQGRIPNDASWCWKGIMQTRNLLSKGLCFSVRNGGSIKIWEDPWIPNPQNFRPRPRNEGQRPESPTLVADLINQDSRTWKEDLVRKLPSRCTGYSKHAYPSEGGAGCGNLPG